MKFRNPQMPRSYVVAMDNRTGEALEVCYDWRPAPPHCLQVRVLRAPGSINAMLCAEAYWRRLPGPSEALQVEITYTPPC